MIFNIEESFYGGKEGRSKKDSAEDRQASRNSEEIDASQIRREEIESQKIRCEKVDQEEIRRAEENDWQEEIGSPKEISCAKEISRTEIACEEDNSQKGKGSGEARDLRTEASSETRGNSSTAAPAATGNHGCIGTGLDSRAAAAGPGKYQLGRIAADLWRRFCYLPLASSLPSSDFTESTCALSDGSASERMPR